SDKGRGNFYLYLENEPSEHRIPNDDGKVAACRTPRGYCIQRTAWIHHLLANDFVAQAQALEKSGQSASVPWADALAHVCAALKPYRNGRGFSDPDQAKPTLVLKEIIVPKLPGKKCPEDAQ